MGQWYQLRKSTMGSVLHPIQFEEIQQFLESFLFSYIESVSRVAELVGSFSRLTKIFKIENDLLYIRNGVYMSRAYASTNAVYLGVRS